VVAGYRSPSAAQTGKINVQRPVGFSPRCVDARHSAEKAGKNVAVAKIDSVSGKIELRFQESGASPAETVNEWDGAK